eukprot:123848_1
MEFSFIHRGRYLLRHYRPNIQFIEQSILRSKYHCILIFDARVYYGTIEFETVTVISYDCLSDTSPSMYTCEQHKLWDECSKVWMTGSCCTSCTDACSCSNREAIRYIGYITFCVHMRATQVVE